MPCYITGSYEGDLQLNAQENAKVARQVTDLLCQACNAIENDEQMPEEVKTWWQQHQKIDESKL